MQRIKFPVCFSDEKLFERDEAKYQKYLERYERSEDHCLQYVTALIRDEKGRILVGWNKKHGSWQIPSGKTEKGEDRVMTLERELDEETGLTVVETKYLGNSKVMLNGMVWQGHFYETKIEGVLEAKEIDTIEEFKWVGFVESDNDLGFALSDGETVVDDVEEILTYWHMFAEVYRLTQYPQYQKLVENSGKLEVPVLAESNIFAILGCGKRDFGGGKGSGITRFFVCLG